MAISINQISTGMGISMDNNIFVVLEHQHVKPGKGGAFARLKIKNLKTQQILDRTVKSSDKIEEIHLEESKMQYSYASGDELHFMDLETFEDVIVFKNILGDSIRFLQENVEVKVLRFDHEILNVALPTFINVEITHTEPGLKGDSSKAGTKSAVIDTGATIQVPLFIEQGEVVKIDTRTGEYIERAKK